MCDFGRLQRERRPARPEGEAPPPAVVEQEQDAGLVKIDHPEQFPLATAAARNTAPELNVTGVVSADVSRNVPVISLASGRVVDIRARLGDTVTKGQLLMRVQSADMAAAFADYRHAPSRRDSGERAVRPCQAALRQGRHGAQKDLEVAQDTAEKAKVDVETALERLKLLGADVDHPSPIIDIVAPASGVITEQNVTAAAGVKTLDNSPNLFTIADLSNVWVMCDVYENDLAKIHVGDSAEIRLNAYPDRVLSARIANIGPILDPEPAHRQGAAGDAQSRAAAARHVRHRHIPRPEREMRAVVPASAILHLHDRDWVYVPADGEDAFAAWKWPAARCSRPICRKSLRASSPATASCRTRWCCRTPSEQ